MLPVGFEPTVSAGERPQTYSLDRAATGTGRTKQSVIKISVFYLQFIYAFGMLSTWRLTL